MLVDLRRIGKPPYADIMPMAATRKMEESFVAKLHLLQDGRVSLKVITQSFIHFRPAVVVLRFNPLDSLNLIRKESELTPQNPLNRSSADI